jgi:SHS2 domain-containing protein
VSTETVRLTVFKADKIVHEPEVKKKYRLIDHTADFGVHVFGENERDLFQNAAFAMYDLITDVSLLSGIKSRQIRVTGDDRIELMFNWLRELLYLWSGKLLLVHSTHIDAFSETGLRAAVIIDPFDPCRHVINSDIKAVTYHQLQVNRTSKGWESKIIFDV